ncbi:uncharacterized protein BO88DRAFT_439053 [Aspergillus vadensis CBS 113365]|uniref:Uncharacterized protein n=1 Tax=Aspergillus vadensis (strain CBS 113365 / IMI 142717 / IBT 24658) TaxID=1448311 RepID=A0A319AWJ6_ASPVC|nr:hypothetical protein BO88DRAFT_439053 [Aspergillus vadensis CBS 113365]PYH63974.1 hypothetical protein BO88DRAFT_439053 [Aspergillus vadensis CBS 113365]
MSLNRRILLPEATLDSGRREQGRRREAAERREEEERQAREEAERREEERKAREDAERRVQPNSLFHLLDRCHNSLSQAIRVEADTTLTTQDDTADPVNRLYPKHIIPWRDFPQLQEQIWNKFNYNITFTMRPLFPSDTQINYVVMNIQNRLIYSEASLRNFERHTVNKFVEKVIEVSRDNKPLRDEFGIQGQVTFYDRANPTRGHPNDRRTRGLEEAEDDIPNQDAQADVQADDEMRLHRTAIGQVLAFTLQALSVEPPTQKWHDVAHDQLTTWKVEYLDMLREIPDTLHKDPLVSDYRLSHWKPDRKIHNTRARVRARCQPGASTLKHLSTEGSGSD